MDKTLAILGIIAAGVIGFFIGKSSHGVSTSDGADFTLFKTTPGSDGFVQGEVLKKKMKGKTFHWKRVGTRPAAGSWFEIRPKGGRPSILDPEIPSGMDDIYADVKPGTPNGTSYYYDLWQVLETGGERQLEDPEIVVSEM